MIQDIEPQRFNNQYSNRREPEDHDMVLSFSEKMIFAKVMDDENLLEFMTYGELKKITGCDRKMENISNEKTADDRIDRLDNVVETAKCKDNLIYLFSVDDTAYFLWNGDTRLTAPGYDYRSMYKTRACHPKTAVLAAATGWHLSLWYRTNRFCGACGERTVHDEKERMLRCPSCGRLIFPVIAPAVIVGVTDGDRIILTTYAGREYKRYALIAGFTEIGESAEQTVRREVMEEVGISVKNITYYKSQPWGYDSNLLMGYFCQADIPEGSDDHLTIDRQELATGEWVKREDIPDYPEHLSLTHEMMMYFKEHGQGIISK